MQLLRGAAGPSDDPALDVAIAHALLRRASRGESGPVLRVYRPQHRVAAFSRRDTLLPGFPGAVRAVRDAGFAPVIRPQGGRAVAYTEQALVVDHIHPHPGFPTGMDARFATYGALWAEVLGARGVDARVGAVPGEYCPGAFSVNARGQAKLVGTAQRLVRRAWLFSAVAIYDDADVIGQVLTEVYDRLALPFDVASVGAIRKEAPGLSLDALAAAVVHAYGPVSLANLAPDVLEAAKELLPDHGTSSTKCPD